MKKTEEFGPFINVPAELIKFAGWSCQSCRQPVRRMGIPAPPRVPRMLIYSCPCGSIGCWEDEDQPTQNLWSDSVRLLCEMGATFALFNGNKLTLPDFQGVN